VVAAALPRLARGLANYDVWEAAACAPMIVHGPVLRAARARVAGRAAAALRRAAAA
jgi:hypothetical protein